MASKFWISFTCWFWIWGALASPLQDMFVLNERTHGAVASESAICSQIGIDLIRIGGNAADAMVGTTLCVGVIGMYHSGIGGGGFMLVRDKDGNYESIDYRESAPAAAFEDMYKDNVKESVFGALSVGIPGELRGLEHLHRKYGMLPWRTVVRPAVGVARRGFVVGEDLVRYMAAAVSGRPTNFLVDDPVWAEDFAPNGTLLGLGDIITRKRYADTLETIGRNGVDEFYEGSLAQSMVDFVKKEKGIMTMEDLKNYQVGVRKAVSINYRGYKLFSTGAPSGGSVCLSMLKTMEQFDTEDSHDVNLTTHRFDEAMRFAYAARAELGDPDFVADIGPYEHLMLSAHKAKETRNRIHDNETQPVEAYDPQHMYTSSSHGTSHIVTTDNSGLAISSTTTINLLFGAQIMTPDTGIILNDEMNDFSIPGERNEFGFAPSPANFIRAGKRPLSSISPVIAEFAANGSLAFVTGAAGGSRIISATALTVWHLAERGSDMRQAIAAPRLHDQLMPNTVAVEWSLNNGTVAALRDRGHNVTWVSSAWSSVQGIRLLWNGTYEAVGEVRQYNSGGFTC